MIRADPVALDIFDYGGYTFQSEEDARSQQDAILGSIFDIKKIKSICSSSGGFDFGHNITIQPGAKGIQIMGKKLVSFNLEKPSLLSYQLYRDRMVNDIDVIEEAKKTKENPADEIKMLQAEKQISKAN